MKPCTKPLTRPPTVSLKDFGSGRFFQFNAAASKHLTGPYTQVSRGKFRGEEYLCLRNTDRPTGPKITRRQHKDSGGDVRIAAESILEFLGLAGTDKALEDAVCQPIRGGLAIKIHSKELKKE